MPLRLLANRLDQVNKMAGACVGPSADVFRLALWQNPTLVPPRTSHMFQEKHVLEERIHKSSKRPSTELAQILQNASCTPKCRYEEKCSPERNRGALKIIRMLPLPPNPHTNRDAKNSNVERNHTNIRNNVSCSYTPNVLISLDKLLQRLLVSWNFIDELHSGVFHCATCVWYGQR
jgi:hypothetical protein